MNKPVAVFLEGSLFRHVATMSLTASLGIMAIFMVDFVDMIFISMLGKEELAAAVGYAGAILFFTSSFGIGISISGGVVVARALGAGDMDLARRRASATLALGVVFGAIFAAVVWLSRDALIALMGAQGQSADLATGYLGIIIPSLPFLIIGMVGSGILRAHGRAGMAMRATLTGGVVNAILDPILIFGFSWELTGAALASVMARLALAVAVLVPIFRHIGGLELPRLRALGADFGVIATVAGPAILTQLATPIGQAYVTRSMAQYGESAVAGMAIVARLTPVAFGVIFALSGAVGPIIGQNFGAGRHGRVLDTYRNALLFTALVVGAISVCLYGLRVPLAQLFGATGIDRDLLYLFCGPLALLFFFNGVIFVSNAGFNNLGYPLVSTAINWGRNTIGTVPLIILGSAWLGPEGVLIGQAVGGVAFGLLSYTLAYRLMVRASQRPPAVPKTQASSGAQAGAFQPHIRLMQLFYLRR